MGAGDRAAARAEERAAAEPEAELEGEGELDLARWGPEVAPGEIVVGADEVLVRLPKKRAFGELRTARVATRSGYRYLSGTGDTFLRQLFYFLLACGARQSLVTLLADGGHWLRLFYAELQQRLPRVEFVLDWFHLKKKCLEKLSMICRGRKVTLTEWQELLRRLWRGEVERALAPWERLRPEGRNEAQLDELLGYLRTREHAIPNYRERRLQRRFNGSGQVEKANYLLVARRQKRQGMHWNVETSDALAALKTLMLNGGWDFYWQEHRVLPLVAP